MPSPTAATQTRTARHPRRRLWAGLVIAGILLAGAGGAWWWWKGRQQAQPGEAAALAARRPAQYLALEPAFVVNLADTDVVRYLQADVELLTRDDATLAALVAHSPAIRNRLLLLFGQHDAAQLAQRAGKERLQQSAREEVRELLRDEGAQDQVEAVIFTSLVIQ